MNPSPNRNATLTMKPNHNPILNPTLGNSGIFFELKHWKEGKKKTSCRCWALVEREEIEDGEHSMELCVRTATTTTTTTPSRALRRFLFTAS